MKTRSRERIAFWLGWIASSGLVLLVQLGLRWLG